MKFNKAYSFDDLLLVPKYSEVVSRSLVSTTVDLGKGFIFDIPIISSNMTNVTEVAMALALTEAKGLAILHRFCTTEEQVKMFKDCVTQNVNATKYVGASIGVKEEDKQRLDSLVSAGCKIICIDVAHGYSKVALDMTRYVADKYPEVLLISGNAAEGQGAVTIARAGADVIKVGVGGGCFAAGTRILMHSGQYKNIEDVIPGDKVINMHGRIVDVTNTVCTGEKEVLQVKYGKECTYVTEDHLFYLSSKDYLKPSWKRIKDAKNHLILMPKELNTKHFISFMKDFLFNEIISIEETNKSVLVYDLEVDCPSHSFIANNAIVHNSICTTRIQTGNGVPMLTAIESTFQAREKSGLNFKIVSDGGAKNSGDMVKALAIGADMMMTGSLLAGTPEAPGAIYEMNGIKYKEYAGSSTHKENHVEGVKALVPLKSPVTEVLQSLVEGIRSGCAYQGVNNLEDLKINPEFMEVSYSGFQNESKSHSVKIRE